MERQDASNGGMAIAAMTKIGKGKLGYMVPSQSGNGTYVVAIGDDEAPYCTCPDYELRQKPCKHIYAVAISTKREGVSTESPATVRMPEKSKNGRPTYSQNWSAYDAAQIHEGDWFTKLLRELCDTVDQPPQGFGRPRLPLSDMVFGAGIKVYSTMSGRRGYVRPSPRPRRRADVQATELRKRGTLPGKAGVDGGANHSYWKTAHCRLRR